MDGRDRGCHGVIDDQRDARMMGNIGQCRDVADYAARVGKRLRKERLAGRIGDSGTHRVQRVHIDEIAVPAELFECLAELRDRAAIKPGGGDQSISRLHQRKRASIWAEWPDAVQVVPRPPSRLAIRSSSTAVVGFERRA